MSIATGTPDGNHDANYNREQVLTEAEQSKILDWNLKLKRTMQGLSPDAKLEKGFLRLKFLPMLWARREKGSLPSGKIFEDVTHFPEVRSFQLPYPARINVLGGQMTSEPVSITHYMGGTTTRGDHITKGYTPELCARAIFADPNWCQMYLIWPITEEEDARLAGMASSEEYVDMVQHRKTLMQEADAINSASKKFGINPGQPMPGQEKYKGPVVSAKELMSQAGVTA